MQLTLAAAQRLAANHQNLRAQDEGIHPLDLPSCKFPFHHATLTLTLCPLISARFNLAMIPLACSLDTSMNKCRSRTSTVPTTLPGNPVSPATAFTTSIGLMSM